jgi:TonB family protein
MRVCFVIFLGSLIASEILLGQSVPENADPETEVKTSDGQAGAERGFNVSGLEILNGGNTPADLGSSPLRILSKVRSKWYPRIRELKQSIGRKSGNAVIDVEVKHDGSLGRVKPVASAGDALLDTAALGAIRESAPFARLPDIYRNKDLKLRLHFGYDQPATEKAPLCVGPVSGAHPGGYVLHTLGNGVTPPKEISHDNPEYTEEARRDRYISVVKMAGTVNPEGAFTDLCVLEAAGEGLDEQAMKAISTWRFQPAALQGEPVAVRISVEMSFQLY